MSIVNGAYYPSSNDPRTATTRTVERGRTQFNGKFDHRLFTRLREYLVGSQKGNFILVYAAGTTADDYDYEMHVGDFVLGVRAHMTNLRTETGEWTAMQEQQPRVFSSLCSTGIMKKDARVLVGWDEGWTVDSHWPEIEYLLERQYMPMGISLKNIKVPTPNTMGDGPVIMTGGLTTVRNTGPEPLQVGDLVILKFPRPDWRSPSSHQIHGVSSMRRELMTCKFANTKGTKEGMRALLKVKNLADLAAPLPKAVDPVKAKLDMMESQVIKAMRMFARAVYLLSRTGDFTPDGTGDSGTSKEYDGAPRYGLSTAPGVIMERFVPSDEQIPLDRAIDLLIAGAHDNVKFAARGVGPAAALNAELRKLSMEVGPNLVSALRDHQAYRMSRVVGVCMSNAQPGNFMDLNAGFQAI